MKHTRSTRAVALSGLLALAAVLAASGAADAAVAPTVVSGGASAVTPTSAVVAGTVDPNGVATSWYFQYGTGPGYGSRTPPGQAGAGTAAVAVSAALGGLSPGTTYHYRIVADSAAGATYGADARFSTGAVAPAVSGSYATSIGDTSAELVGTVAPHGAPTRAYFEYGTTTAYGLRSAVTDAGSSEGTVSVSLGVGGLLPRAVYHFRLVATNAGGTATGPDASFETTGAPGVTTAAAGSVSATSAVLNGVVAPDGHATTWFFQYGTTTGYGASTPGRSLASGAAAAAVSSPVSGLSPATVYHYRLVAVSSAGTRYGGDATFSTLGPALSVSPSAVIFGRPVTLLGTVPAGNASVTVFAQPYGAPSFVAVATVLSGSGGAWSLVVRPQLATAYKALWQGVSTAPVSVSVAPQVNVRPEGGGRFLVSIRGVESFRGRAVLLERLVGSNWVTLTRARLNATSSAVVSAAWRAAPIGSGS